MKVLRDEAKEGLFACNRMMDELLDALSGDVPNTEALRERFHSHAVKVLEHIDPTPTYEYAREVEQWIDEHQEDYLAFKRHLFTMVRDRKDGDDLLVADEVLRSVRGELGKGFTLTKHRAYLVHRIDAFHPEMNIAENFDLRWVKGNLKPWEDQRGLPSWCSGTR